MGQMMNTGEGGEAAVRCTQEDVFDRSEALGWSPFTSLQNKKVRSFLRVTGGGGLLWLLPQDTAIYHHHHYYR